MRRSTVVFVLLFVLLAGIYYILNNREDPADITTALEPEDVVTYIFSADEGVPSGIRIESQEGEVVEVRRNEEGVWTMIQPIETAANSGSVEAAASQITTMRVVETLPGVDLEVVGLVTPAYELTVHFGAVERIVLIGVITPTGNGYYALKDDGNVVIVSAVAVDSLLSLLENPPYLETPTPSPTATNTRLPDSFDPATATPVTPTP